MRRIELEYPFPEDLIARQPVSDFRTLLVQGEAKPAELTKRERLNLFRPADLLVLNDTKVENRRVFAGDLEILFVQPLDGLKWEVLFAARDQKIGAEIRLPGDIRMRLVQKGLPQIVELSAPMPEGYFLQFGEPALPPYIQKARGERRARPQDQGWYQTEWARHQGSSAAPTASLHFTAQDIAELQAKDVQVAYLTLHVGLGTFLPIKVDQLSEHHMHSEPVHIPMQTIDALREARSQKGRVFALGTTVARALESWGSGRLSLGIDGSCAGATDLFITPGFQFKVVDGLLTNFHQPGSTLLALVAGFAGLERVREAYAWAIERRFRLFSYGDLSVWIRN